MIEQSIVELSQSLRKRDISSKELIELYIKRCKQLNPIYNCMVTLCEETALRQAEVADQRHSCGDAHALTGIPIVQKDIFCTRGIKTTCGSKMLDNFLPPYDATVVKKLQAVGAVTLGKANMDEFAMGSSTETSYYGPTLNPWDRNRVPGGSSGGSACAVACRIAPAATGSDTGGSIRQPSSFCGVTGLKPTYGRISRYGMIAFASSLDQAGTITNSAEDAAQLLNVMAGKDALDSTSLDRPAEDFARDLENKPETLRIGVPRQYFSDALDKRVEAIIQDALQTYESLGAKITELDLPSSPLAVPAYYVIASAECSSNLARYDGVRYGYRCDAPQDLQDMYYRSRTEGFGKEVKRRYMMGTFVLSSGYHDKYYIQACKARRLILNDFLDAMKKVDVIITPSAPTTAFKLREKMSDPVAMYLSDMYTIPSSLAGLPAISIPVGFSDHLPVGMQIIGRHFDEARILQLAHQYQKETGWHKQVPPAVRQ